MIVQDQTSVTDFLSRPETHDLEGSRVERIDTHISILFLAGERVFKLKRAVKFPYLDFSTIEKRKQACEAEVRINRRTAPDIYLGTRAVAKMPDGSLSLTDQGEVLDWLVEMKRFDQAGLFDRLARKCPRYAANGRLGRRDRSFPQGSRNMFSGGWPQIN